MAQPRLGQKRSDGKVYAGENYGYQNPATFSKLKEQGKFKVGAQALDRATQAVSRVLPKPVKDYAKAVQSAAAKNAETTRRNNEKTAIGRFQNRVTSQPSATERVLKGVSDKTNVDQRIVNTTANVAQAAIAKKALGGTKAPLGGTKAAKTAAPKPTAASVAPKKPVAGSASTRRTLRSPSSSRPQETQRALGRTYNPPTSINGRELTPRQQLDHMVNNQQAFGPVDRRRAAGPTIQRGATEDQIKLFAKKHNLEVPDRTQAHSRASVEFPRNPEAQARRAAKKAADEGRSVGAAARADVAGAKGRYIYRPAVDGAVTKSGERLRGRTSNYRATIGSRTKTNTPTARRLAAETSPAAQRSSNRIAGTGRQAPVVRREPVKSNKPTEAAKAQAAKELNNNTAYIKLGKNKPADIKPASTRVLIDKSTKEPTESTFSRTAKRSDSPSPPRSRVTAQTRAEFRRTYGNRRRDIGLQGVDARTPAGVNRTANQARGARIPKGDGTAYGPGNGRDLSVRRRPTPQVRGDVKTNAERAASSRKQSFKTKADRIISDRMSSDEMLAKSGTARRAIKNALVSRARKGSKRVYDAAYQDSVNSAANTRQETLRYRGSGRQAYQEPNQMTEGRNRAGGLTEAQIRARAGRVKTSQGKPSEFTAPNPKRETQAALEALRKRGRNYRRPDKGVDSQPGRVVDKTTAPQRAVRAQKEKQARAIERKGYEKLRSIQTGKKVTVRDGSPTRRKAAPATGVKPKPPVRNGRDDVALRKRNASVTKPKRRK